MKLLSLLLTTLASTATAIPSASLNIHARDAVDAAELSESPTYAIPSSTAPNFGYNELWNLQRHFYDTFKYPQNVKQAEMINSTIFSEDVQGRVSDTRNFVGRELNTEYIFGLFIPTDSYGIIGQPHDYEIIQFVANQNIASATTRVWFNFPSFNNVTLPVTIDTWLTWNAEKQISQYDVTFRWFAYLMDTLITSLNPINATDAQRTVVTNVAKSICKTHATYCNGTNTQYTSNEECLTFLTQDIRVGSTFELGMNTLMCRSVHEIMIKYRPDVHCSHIGRDGGGMCGDDMPYEAKVTEDFFKNSAWIPTTAQQC